MSILSEIKQQKHSLDDLAKLPQSLIMQMAQRKQIMPEMVAPILSRKAEMIEAVAKTKALQSAPQAMSQPTVLENLMARNVQPPTPQPSPQSMAQAPQPMTQSPQSSVDLAGLGQMQAPPQFAGGGIVAFAEGDYVDGDDGVSAEDDEFARHQANLNRILSTYGAEQYASPTMARSSPSTDTIMALASPTSKRYEMERSSVLQKTPTQSRPEVREVTKERVEEVKPQESPKAKERVEVKATPATPATSAKTPKRIPNPLDHPYAGMVAEDAKKHGVDPKISLRLLNNETGGIKNPETAVSSAGAVGIAQFMPKTAGQYKIDPTNPKQASDAMNRHVKHLMRQYGDPQIVAIAYNWGEGNTNRWLKTGADPRRLPKETQNYLDKFMRTALAQGGEVKGYAEGGEINAQSYSEKMKKVFGYEPFHGPTMQKYMSGGEVKHFQTGDFVSSDPMGMGGSEIMDVDKKPFGLSDLGKWFLKQTGNPDWKIEEANKKALAEDAKNKAVKPVAPAKPPNPQITTTKAPLVAPTQEQIDGSKTAIERQAELEPEPQMSKPTQESLDDVFAALNEKPAQPSVDKVDNVAGISPEYDQLMKDLRESKEASAKQRKEDKAYAMIMAGLATMGGESPNALTNIAKGQATGLGMLQENRKQSAAEDAKILQMQGTVLRYKDAALLAKEAQNQTTDYRNRLAEVREMEAKNRKDATDVENQRKAESELEKKRANMQRNLDKIKELHFDIPMLEYKELMSQAEKEVLPADRERLIARANKVLRDAEANYLADPIAQRFKKALYPEIDFDKYTKSSAPPPAVDTTGFKRVN